MDDGRLESQRVEEGGADDRLDVLDHSLRAHALMLSDDRWYRGRMQKGWAGWVLPESPGRSQMERKGWLSSKAGYAQAGGRS